MRDPQRKKLLDLRRVHLAGDHPRLRAIFSKLHPEDSTHKERWTFRRHWPQEWMRRCNEEEQWIYEKIKVPYNSGYDMGNAPAHFRRDLNRRRRNQENQAIRNLIASGCGEDFDNFLLPRFRRDANWNWW